jgi:hypothetical protein
VKIPTNISNSNVWLLTFFHRPDDGGSKHLWNVGKLLPDYTAQHPRRQLSSIFICSDSAAPLPHLSFSVTKPSWECVGIWVSSQWTHNTQTDCGTTENPGRAAMRWCYIPQQSHHNARVFSFSSIKLCMCLTRAKQGQLQPSTKTITQEQVL